MVDSISFKTRARTVDHLGREQIADCPTAISELWKNSYDAYARSAELHIFDGDIPVAALVDDGHGMNAEEFIDKWLVLGTESKATDSVVDKSDRNGLPFRSRQGQKGIGRLSSAFLGPLLLIFSKRKKDDYVAALIDWRLFENPFLMLQDIKVPVVNFSDKADIFEHLPAMKEQLKGNLAGDYEDEKRDQRIIFAWDSFDELEHKDGFFQKTTRTAIDKTVEQADIAERHFSKWSVWNGESEHGTAMFIFDIQDELSVQLTSEAESTLDPAIELAKEDFVRSLSAFTDPYVDKEVNVDFSYAVMGWEDQLGKVILSEKRSVDYSNFEIFEHVIDGEIDEHGVFRGRIKSFGKWLDEECIIRPTVRIPKTSRTKIGPFKLKAGTFEREINSSTIEREQYSWLKEQCEMYAGFMVHRDGLRVMPYGRHDNDYFGVEERRGKNAGRYFWATRNMFGGIRLTRDGNPNLRDKAGREGLIKNGALKALREILVNIFVVTADNYFGAKSKVRKIELPKIKEYWGEQKALEEQETLRKRRLREFRSNLKKFEPELEALHNKARTVAESFKGDDTITSEVEIKNFRHEAQKLSDDQKAFRLIGKPKKLSVEYEERLQNYQEKYAETRGLIQQLIDTAQQGLRALSTSSAEDIVKVAISTNKGQLTKRMNSWVNQASTMLKDEVERLKNQVKERTEAYEQALNPIRDRIDSGLISAIDALPEIDVIKEKFDDENEEFFAPYLSALMSLQESIDLEGLANFGMEEVSELRSELERLNALAQLGITVEILGHEFEGLDNTITQELDALPDECQKIKSIKNIRIAHQQLTENLRFLSPLKLSGRAEKSWISGENIIEYIDQFFGDVLEKNEVTLEATKAFKAFKVFDFPGKIFPVFINLINNSRYWVCRDDANEKAIKLDVLAGKIVIGDDGPGVTTKDIGHLFTLFFTRKTHGGRGVGLYLCRANLSAGGHKIDYETDPDKKIMPGANFAIEFRGVQYE